MIRKILRKIPFIYSIARNVHIFINNIKNRKNRKKLGYLYLEKLKECKYDNVIWYFCIPLHNNLGDYAQYYCIKKLMNESFSNYNIFEVPTSVIKYDYVRFFENLKKKIRENDIIIFQSGYTSTNLHDDEYVHRKIVKNFVKNKIVFFPQTVRYTSNREAMKTANIYRNHNHLLFITRDEVSFNKSKELFVNNKIEIMPDIVTTLFGKNKYLKQRKGVIYCIRHDSEKLYTDLEIKKVFDITDEDLWTDTTLNANEKCNESLLMEKIDLFSNYAVTVTDRFHGTIFSMIAGTPVIVLKTSDHKVTEGAKWFMEICPDDIIVAKDLNEAKHLIPKMKMRKMNNNDCYFQKKYYDKLINLIKEI